MSDLPGTLYTIQKSNPTCGCPLRPPNLQSNNIMRHYLPLLAAFAVLPGLANAEPGPISGEMTIAYGWSKDANGNKVDLKGRKVKYRGWPVQASPIVPTKASFNWLGRMLKKSSREKPSFSPPQSVQESNNYVYFADAGAGWGYVEGNPSSLDDVVMTSAGIGKPWTQLRFGFNYVPTSFERWLFRIRVWGTNQDNPAPQNDFVSEYADFGLYWTASVPSGQHIFEIDITAAAVATTDTSLYIAYQARTPAASPILEDGEGAFKFGEVDFLFNAAAPPSIGSSEDQFWYDWDPVPDGRYENTEIDVFEGSRADHVGGIQVSATGAVQELTSISAVMGNGRFVSGNLLSILNGGDSNLFRMNEAYNVARDTSVGEVIVDFFNPVSNINSIRINGIGGTTINSTIRRIHLFNFATNTWVLMNQANTPTPGLLSFSESYGGPASSIPNFIGTVNNPLFGPVPAIRARVGWQNTTFNNDRSWQMQLDLLECFVTTP
ncbi:hypothetical protein CCB80_08365 [Armatimonadetes bacterium Uphvl-Ar1]|nr:hypothetical protein CCB80_08365 [Armatimonadetes bacterium Uphvl-Ar1]